MFSMLLIINLFNMIKADIRYRRLSRSYDDFLFFTF